MPEMPSNPAGSPDGDLVVDESGGTFWLKAEGVSAKVDACGGGNVGGLDGI